MRFGSRPISVPWTMSPKAEASPIGATSHATDCSGVRVDLPCAPKGGRRLDADGNMIGHLGQAAAGKRLGARHFRQAPWRDDEGRRTGIRRNVARRSLEEVLR